MSENIVLEKSKDFAIRILKLHKYLIEEKREYVISKQIVRSGASIGANLSEAVFGSSKKDFLHKVRISLKEASETVYWLDLLHKTEALTYEQYNSLVDDCKELVSLLVAIAKTTDNSIK